MTIDFHSIHKLECNAWEDRIDAVIICFLDDALSKISQLVLGDG